MTWSYCSKGMVNSGFELGEGKLMTAIDGTSTFQSLTEVRTDNEAAEQISSRVEVPSIHQHLQAGGRWCGWLLQRVSERGRQGG